MKSVLIFPIKTYSERIPGKNFKLINGCPLYQHLPMVCKASGMFDLISIDTDSQEIRDWATKQGFDVLTRVSHLATNEANGNDLLRHHATIYKDYDHLWQGFVTTPFITIGTICNLVNQFQAGVRRGWIDSIMTCKELRGFFWSMNGKPLAHRPDVMPRSQDLRPIYQEVHGLFGITRDAFNITRTRAGAKVYPFSLSNKESMDIDWSKDLEAVQSVTASKEPQPGPADSHLGCA